MLSTPPPVDYEYIAEHIELPAMVTPSHAKIRLDGNIFSIDYQTAYAAAWQQMAGRAKELAIPLLYMQRHSLELILKGVLRSLLGVRYQLQLGHDMFGWPLEAKLNDQQDWDKDWDNAHGTHNFGLLFEKIDKNRQLLELPTLPADFHAARAIFEDIDPNGDGARFRYPLVWDKQIKARVSSFPSWFAEPEMKPKIVQLNELSAVLGRLASEYCADLKEKDGEPATFRQALAETGRSAHWSFESDIRALEKATNAREVKWTRTRTPALNVKKHPDFAEPETARNLCPEYVSTDREGRRLVVVMIYDGVKSYGGGKVELHNDYLFGRQRMDEGTLGQLITPITYQSNLVRAALESAGVDNDTAP